MIEFKIISIRNNLNSKNFQFNMFWIKLINYLKIKLLKQITIYINNSSVGTGTNGDNLTENKYRICAYGGSTTGYNFNGRIASVKIYKGVGFTSTMVTQNYNIQKARFGL